MRPASNSRSRVTRSSIVAVTFDVFGTVVDWRSGIIREGRAFGARKGVDLDWETFADAWRALYQPSMERVRSGERPWVKLDVLNRENLVELLARFGVERVDDEEIDDLNRGWHRLDPWPDVLEGLRRLHSRYLLATRSNGNIGLLANMARRAGLPWDAILGAEPTHAYKPMREAYVGSCEILDLAPEQVMLVAAHNDDLFYARSHGLRIAFVARPDEYGPQQTQDLRAEHDFDFVAEDFIDLARQLGC